MLHCIIECARRDTARPPAGADPPRMERGAPMAWQWQPGHRSRRARSMETLAAAEPAEVLCGARSSVARVPWRTGRHRWRAQSPTTSPGLPATRAWRVTRPAPRGARTFRGRVLVLLVRSRRQAGLSAILQQRLALSP